MDIKAVGYVGIGAADPKTWLSYGTGVLGLMPARAVPGESWGPPLGPTVAASGPASGGRGIAEDGSVYLKMDERQWRIGVHPSDTHRGLMYLGLEVAGEPELEQAIAELRANQISVERGTEADAFARAVTGIARCLDPSGNRLELYYGPTIDYNFRSPIADQRFVARPPGVRHFIFFVQGGRGGPGFFTPGNGV